MTLIEIIAVHLGPAIAKSVLKHWLKDSQIASDTSSSLIDLLRNKTTDIIAQKRAQRQFEAIGERVGEGLLTVFEAEGAHISENGKQAVVLAVAETLNKTSIDTSLLAQRSLEPRALAEHLFSANPDAARLFSEPERALYERVIEETSQYIVDIASQLPSFNERTLAEVFKRQNQLQNIAERILEEVRRITEQSKDVDAEAAIFEVAYRRAVIRNLDELQLFGVDVSAINRRHRLSVAYVTLSVKQESEGEPESLLTEKDIPTVIGQPEEDESVAAVPVDKVLQNAHRLIILGEAGSGKTTLLQWIAVHSAQKDFQGSLSTWNDSIPFFIRLRQCSEGGLPTPEEFPKFITSAITGTMPHGWVHHQLTSGNAVVLIDGLDELGEPMRREVRVWLHNLVDAYGNSRFIVSSRPYAITDASLQKLGFNDAELMPMELPDIMEFVDHWHAAVREEVQEDFEKVELESLCQNLKSVIQGNAHIRKLSTNPLLCAMLCALHRDRQRRLPSDRIELYDACFRMLVDRRDVERGIDLRDYPVLTYRQKRALLQDLAYWLLKNDYSMAGHDKIENRLTTKLRVMEGVSELTNGSEVLRLFVERSGILREPVKGQIDFTHRTFQEFLGAQAALDEGDVGLLVKSADEQQWREVVVLAAGLARSNERALLIKELIQRGDQEARERHQLHLLAVTCLETSIELEPDIKELVLNRLETLVPPRNMTEAKALSSAGDLALPFLVYHKAKNYYANIAAACVRTLVLIGGDSAQFILSDYGSDFRLAVRNELTRGWDNFDRDEYASRIFSKQKHLSLRRPSSLAGIQCLHELIGLTVDGGYLISLPSRHL
jgi:predicted NACHT family NTPase